jgi:transglutaminase-like putative cysteine protease
VSAPAPPIDRDLAATAALAGYSLVVAAGFARVFSGWEFMWDLAVLVVLGHGASFAMRRLRVSGWFAVPFLAVFLVWLLVVQAYRDSMTALIPTGATWDQVQLEIGLVRDQFQTAVAPVLYGAGWATLAGLALVLAIVMSDSFAFRAEARGEALVPGGVLFVFIAALSSERLRVTLTGLLIAAGIVAVVGLRALHDRHRRVELRSNRAAVSLLVPTAMATAIAVALLAGVVGPRIPGAQAEPLYETRGRGNGVTNIISPLVDIRSRLTSRGSVELFRVNADGPAYWRVTTLPAFDGQRFSLPQRPLERIEDEVAPDGGPSADGAPENRQQIQVLGLGGVLIPAAADPVGAEGFSDGTRLDLRLNRDTSSLIAPDDLGTGDLFRVVSARPQLTPDQLRAATSANPPDDIFTELPDDLPGIVDELATEVTAGTTNSYDAAIALQRWFRDPDEFSYSLEVQSGHGTNAIESFFNERVGYCEQFAATFATMARALGIPSRVAVGFTPGVLNDEGWYSVIGKNAHAWPELWFDGIGWVAFEPTPGRGAPGAESYTGVAPEQDDSGPDGAGAGQDPTASTLPPTPSTAVPPQTTVPAGGAPSTTAPSGPFVPSDGGLDDFGGEDGFPAESSGGVPWRTIVVVALILAVLVGPWAVRAVRTRRERAGDLRDRVRSAWGRAMRAAMQAGVTGRDSMTVHEWATATAAELPVAARPMAALADVVDRVTFGPPDTVDLERQGAYGTTLGHDCELWADQIARIATDTLSGPQRVRRYFTNWS